MRHVWMRERRDELPSLSPVCTGCRHLDHERLDARRCRAFPAGVPDAIWLGEHDHRTPYDGDRGIRFEPMTDTDWSEHRERTNALWAARERSRARTHATQDGALQAEMIAGLPATIKAQVTVTGTRRNDRPVVLQRDDVAGWWLAGARYPTYARALIEDIEGDGLGRGMTAFVRLTPAIPEFWESLDEGSAIELCEGPETIGYATITHIERLTGEDSAAPARELENDPCRPLWTDVGWFEVELHMHLAAAEATTMKVRSGDITTWSVPWSDRRLPASCSVELVNADALGAGDAGLARLVPLAPYLWHRVQVGTSLKLWDQINGGDGAGVATVTRTVRTAVPVTLGGVVP